MTSVDSSKRLYYPLTEKNTVYRTQDGQGAIVVHDVERWRILTFGSIYEQTCIDINDRVQLVHEYTQAMLLPLLAIKPAHVTLLGLGGGALVHALLHTLSDAFVDVVELRQKVIDVAYSQFFLPKSERMNVHCMDAGIYVRKAPAASTEFLLCDLYNAYEASDTQLDAGFYRHCKNMMTDDGWLAINFHQLPTIEHPAIKALCTEFSALYLCVVNSGNWIILASNSVSARDNSWQRTQQLEGSLRRQLATHRHRLIRIELNTDPSM